MASSVARLMVLLSTAVFLQLLVVFASAESTPTVTASGACRDTTSNLTSLSNSSELNIMREGVAKCVSPMQATARTASSQSLETANARAPYS